MKNWETGTEIRCEWIEKKEDDHFWRIAFQTQFNSNFFAIFAVCSPFGFFSHRNSRKTIFCPVPRLFNAKIQELEQMSGADDKKPLTEP